MAEKIYDQILFRGIRLSPWEVTCFVVKTNVRVRAPYLLWISGGRELDDESRTTDVVP